MSNIIPPLLNSSPPPISTILLDDDDEFGTFTMATDLHCDADVSALSLTCESPIPKITSVDDNLDRRKSENENECDSFQDFPEIPPDISVISELDLEDDKEISEILENEVSNCTVVNDTQPINVEVTTDFSHSEEEFADFNTYTQNDNVFESISDSPNFFNVGSETTDEANDEEFGDYNDYSIQTSGADIPPNVDDNIKVMFPILENVTEDYVDENFTSTNVIFVQLRDITDTPALLYQWSKSMSQSCLLQALNIDTRNILFGPRWNESMPRYAATLGFTPLEPVKSDVVPSAEAGQESIQQCDIPTAEFDWVGSGLINPLETTPTKIEKQQTNNGTSHHTNELVSQTELEINKVSVPINTSPSLDKTETDFDDFNSFQPNQAEEHAFNSWPIALRETHISNVKIDDPSWLKPTILTPELPRKDLRDEEFATFQSGNVAPIQESKPHCESEISTIEAQEPGKLESIVSPLEPSTRESESPTPLQDGNDDDDEFTEFQSITCTPQTEPPAITAEPLQPSILQPVKVENAPSASTTINWPDPGITEEDWQRFSLYKPNIKETVIENDIHTKDDDDWSDFVSNQTPHVSQPVQNGFQKPLVSNQYVVLSPKPEEVEDEWNDFVSSESPPAPPVFNRPTRTSLPKLNLDWNSPPHFSSWSSSVTPNIITNPTSFESFQSFTSFDSDLLKNRIANKKTPNIMVQPKKNTVPSISTIPDLEFIAPKNRTWKK